MMMIISPAKKIDENCSISEGSKPLFGTATNHLVKKMKALSGKDLERLMGVSAAIGKLNYDRYQNFGRQVKMPAAHMFKGDTYVGLEFGSLSASDQKYAQKKLRILSGLYGLLSPLDLVAPYRLEMGTRISPKSGMKNLYDYWREPLTAQLKKEIGKKEALINLASDEYSKALNLKEFDVITPVFKRHKDGELKSMGMMSKRARGMMAKYIIENRITDPEELKKFPHFKYSAAHSSDKEWLFIAK